MTDDKSRAAVERNWRAQMLARIEALEIALAAIAANAQPKARK